MVALRYYTFLAEPTKEQWDYQLVNGWAGPDGSSSSTDHMMGVRIGIAHYGWEHRNLAANKHDWRYQLGRFYQLPKSYRKYADVDFRDDCIAAIEEALDGRIMINIGRVRAWGRYYALRLFGGAAWKG